MANYNRKYPQTTGYWVYAHVLPTKCVYIGMSKMQPSKRWQKTHYEATALAPYIEQYGWNNIQHNVLIDGLTKEQAEQVEDWFICKATADGFCINKQRSGGQYSYGKQAYNKQWHKDHKEEKKAYQKQRYSTPEGKIYNRIAAYNQYHPDKVIETPAEAKQKYLEFGYIPNYIKNNDLC